MNNIKTFTEDPKFLQLNKNNKESILKVGQAVCKEEYVFNGNWRNDSSSDGCNASFELINSNVDRKNLVTLGPMKLFNDMGNFMAVRKVDSENQEIWISS